MEDSEKICINCRLNNFVSNYDYIKIKTENHTKYKLHSIKVYEYYKNKEDTESISLFQRIRRWINFSIRNYSIINE